MVTDDGPDYDPECRKPAISSSVNLRAIRVAITKSTLSDCVANSMALATCCSLLGTSRTSRSRAFAAPAALASQCSTDSAARSGVAQRRSGVAHAAQLKAILFDCDGVILESEELHRVAYNKTFEHFKVGTGGVRTHWSVDYYDVLSNTVGGGKPKMRWHFGKVGWPEAVGDAEADRSALIDTLQDWKTAHYESLIASGTVATRPGVLRLIDDARAAGVKVAVCSAATKSAAVATVSSLLGPDRWAALDCFLAGSDVAKLKPDPLIYVTAAERLGLKPEECFVIEDSTVGLKAASAAGMLCVSLCPCKNTQAYVGMQCCITYTRTGAGEPFDEAAIVVSDLDAGRISLDTLRAAVSTGRSAPRLDDRSY